MFAPILTIPLYQQYEYRQPIFEKIQQRLLAYPQNENIVNTMYNVNVFKHPDSITDTILKTKRVFANSLYEINQIIAYGYHGTSRTVIVPVSDFEAGIVNVPVTVIDYHSIQKTTHVINSLLDNAFNDLGTNNNSIKSIWTRYAKSLNINNVSKKGNFLSMIINDQKTTIDQDTYKDFLNQINNIYKI